MIDKTKLENYFEMISSGVSQRQACAALGITRSTIQKFLKANSQESYTYDKASKIPVIKTIDIETSPSIAAAFGRFDQNLSQDNIISEGGIILTACVKTLGVEGVRRYFITDPAERYNGDDSEVVEALWNEVHSADVVVGHKIKRFDLATLKSRLAFYDFPALPKVQIVDTLNMARQMKFNANSLDSLCSYLNIGRKTKHSGISLWIKVMEGDEDALEEMLQYNEQDVLINEEAYLRMRPHANVHPNIALFHNDDVTRCTSCGSEHVEPTGRVVNTAVSSFEEWHCTSCGHRMRGRSNTLSKSKRKSLLTNTP